MKKGEMKIMTAEEDKAIVSNLFEECWNKKNLDAADQYVAVNSIDHNQMNPDQPQGLEGTKQGWASVMNAFPDMRVTISDSVAEGGKVVVRATMQGTHQGEFMGVPATGKKVSAEFIDIVRIDGGKIVERWGLLDMANVMQQLGLMPPPGQP
jgi:steroid delta-isomerase-like uncharacterized protein